MIRYKKSDFKPVLDIEILGIRQWGISMIEHRYLKHISTGHRVKIPHGNIPEEAYKELIHKLDILNMDINKRLIDDKEK